jgi:hypothetical protein
MNAATTYVMSLLLFLFWEFYSHSDNGCFLSPTYVQTVYQLLPYVHHHNLSYIAFSDAILKISGIIQGVQKVMQAMEKYNVICYYYAYFL